MMSGLQGMNSRKINTKYLTGKTYVNLIEILARISHVSAKTADSHLEENEKNWNEYFPKQNTKFIERQWELDMLKYGSYRKVLSDIFMKDQPFVAARNACEVISVYNALVDLGLNDENTTFPKLLNYFEKHESVLKGYFGTSFTGLVRYFKKNGFGTYVVAGKKITKENLDRMEKEFATYIFMSYNNSENIADMIHTMSITREEKGFFIHNSYAKAIYFESLYEAVIKYNETFGWVSRPIIVMGINKPENKV